MDTGLSLPSPLVMVPHTGSEVDSYVFSYFCAELQYLRLADEAFSATATPNQSIKTHYEITAAKNRLCSFFSRLNFMFTSFISLFFSDFAFNGPECLDL